MASILKKFVLLTTCSLFTLLGCTKQNDSLSVIEYSQNTDSSLIDSSSVDNHPAFTEYEKLKIIVANQSFLNSDDQKIGACFSNHAELVSYANQLRYENSELNKFVDELKDEDFENKKLIFTAQIYLRSGTEYLTFNKMYLDNNDLNVLLDLNRDEGGGTADIRCTVCSFFINKDLSYNNVVTLLNNLTGIEYRL